MNGSNVPIEFIVDGIVAEGPTELLHVIGRCGDVPLHVGDIFETVYSYDYAIDSDGSETATPIHVTPIRLRIEVISAYGREVALLGEGMTGRVSLSGEGADRISPPAVLGILNPTTRRAGPIQSSLKVI